MSSTTNRSRVSLFTKIGYAIGGLAEGSVVWAFNGFNFIIYTVGFGLPGTLAGVAVALSILIDGVTDPLIGYLSDHWKSRWGRRHPFIYFSAIPMGASIFFIYSPPEFLLSGGGDAMFLLWFEATTIQWGLALWLFVFASLLKFCLTCYHLPHLGLGAELTDEYLERTRVFRLNTLLSFSGGAMLAICFWIVFFPQGPFGGMDTFVFASSLALFSTCIILLTGIMTHNQIPYLPKTPPDRGVFSWRLFVQEMLGVFRNRNYRMLFYGLLFLASMIGVRETLNVNMARYYWEVATHLIPFFSVATILSYIIGMSMVAKLNQRLEKGGTLRISVLIAVVAATTPILLRTLGWLPENGTTSTLALPGLGFSLDVEWIFLILCFGVFGYYGGLAILNASVYSAIGDVVDEHELETGRRNEGVFYAVRTFFAKLSNALGHLLAGIAIDLIGFPSNAKVGEVDSQVIFELGVFEGLIATLPALGAIYFYGKYKIDKKRHEQIRQELAARAPKTDSA